MNLPVKIAKTINQQLELLKINSLLKNTKIDIYLVGGFLRDCLLNIKGKNDLDFAVANNPKTLAKKIADQNKGSLFTLDEQRNTYRVILKVNGEIWHLDFSKLRGENVEEDLYARDFTINALALDLNLFFKKSHIPIIDPCSGLNDLTKKQIRICQNNVFDDDPLRMLRAIRLSAFLNFKVEKDTLNLIKEKAELIKKSSMERIRDEFFQIFAVNKAHPFIKNLDELNLLTQIVPEINLMKNIDQGPHHQYPLWKHSLETLKAIEYILSNFKDFFPKTHSSISPYLQERIGDDIRRKDFIKFTALLHDTGKPKTKTIQNGKIRFLEHEKVGAKINRKIARRFKLCRKATRDIGIVTENHMRPLHLSKVKKVTSRALYRFFRDTKKTGIDTILIALADARATRNQENYNFQTTNIEQLAQKMMDFYFNNFCRAEEKPLLSGKEIINYFHILPGPFIGTILKKVKEAQIQNLIATKNQALKYIDKNMEEWEKEKQR